jgi:dephospho-CoA kinase
LDGMLNLKKIAVTGGTASGKSSVCRVFQNLGAYVISADQITHQLLSNDNTLIQQIADLLGEQVLKEGNLDRKKVAEIVFRSPAKLLELEARIHPKVTEEIKRQWEDIQKGNTYSLFVVEIPLLFETQDTSWYDATITVISPQEKSISRFCSSTGYGPDEYERRMSRQMVPEEKARRATYVIDNSETLDELEAQVHTLFSKLRQ